MTRPDLSVLGKDIYRTGYIHLSFSVGSEERVNSLTAKLQSAGYEVISGPRFTGDGFYESCVLDSEHNQIEDYRVKSEEVYQPSLIVFKSSFIFRSLIGSFSDVVSSIIYL